MDDRKEFRVLARRIEALLTDDQNARYAASTYDDRIKSTDSVTRKALEEIFNLYGVPKISDVGAVAGRAFITLAAHLDTEFMKKVLVALEKNVLIKEAQAADYALLYDKIRVSEGKPQRWGTQFRFDGSKLIPYPIESPTQLERRRQEVGLISMEQYTRIVEDAYAAKDIAPDKRVGQAGS